MEGIPRILKVAGSIFLLAFEGFSEREAFGIIRKGTVGQGVTIKSREHYRMLNKLDRDLLRLARSYEYALDNGVRYHCDLCGSLIDEDDTGDGPWHFHRGCRLRLLEFLRQENGSSSGTIGITEDAKGGENETHRGVEAGQRPGEKGK